MSVDELTLLALCRKLDKLLRTDSTVFPSSGCESQDMKDAHGVAIVSTCRCSASSVERFPCCVCPSSGLPLVNSHNCLRREATRVIRRLVRQLTGILRQRLFDFRHGHFRFRFPHPF